MSLFADAIQRGNRASQPAASAVVVGTLYYVTDEGVTERSTGSAWEDVTDGNLGGVSGTANTAQDGSDTDKISDMFFSDELTVTELADNSGDAISVVVAATHSGSSHSSIPYTPSPDNDDWNSSTDPGSAQDAIDQLVARVAELERAFTDYGEHPTSDWERPLAEPFLYRNVILPCREITATGNITLTTDDPTYIFIDGNGSNRTITLPAEFTGLCFLIMNISDTETITVQDDTPTTVTTISAGSFKTVIYSGTAWRAL